jgi:hypothetical protein
MPGASVAIAATACGPCSAISARSGSGRSVTPAGSSDSMRGKSSCLRLAFTTRNSRSPRLATMKSSRMPPSSVISSP